MTAAVLAVQGDFLEHRKKLEQLGVTSFEIRKKSDLERHMDGLILPGGESTVQGKLLRELGLLAPIKKRIESGLPVLATCAGLILLAEQISGQEEVHLGTLPVRIKRNAYGRQLGSFHTESELKGIGQVPMTFIRAPYIESVREGVQVLARVEGKIAAVRYGKQMGLSFHPELDQDSKVHNLFLELCGEA